MVLVNSLLIWINSKYARGYFLYYTLQMVCYALGNGNGFTLQNTLFFILFGSMVFMLASRAAYAQERNILSTVQQN